MKWLAIYNRAIEGTKNSSLGNSISHSYKRLWRSMPQWHQIKWLSNRTILAIISAMIVVHLVVLVIFTQQHRSTQKEMVKDRTIQKVMNVLHMIEATPPAQLEQAVRALDEPSVNVSLTEKPLWKARFDELSFWAISRNLRDDTERIALSLQLTNGKWLNIQAAIVSKTWFAQFFLLLLEVIVAVFLLFYAWSINRFTRPLKEFKKAAERLGVDVNARVDIHNMPEVAYGPSVVRETAHAMNKMRERIRDLIRDRTQMLAAISHDLRTPITRLKLRVQLIKDNKLSEQFIRDLDEMETMIAETLSFARDDSREERKVKFDLSSLLMSVCDDLSDTGFPVEIVEDLPRLTFYGRPIAMKRALINLIENAVKYGKVARVKLSKNNNNIEITIDDDGPGIAEKELEAVFAPFYRCEPSRSRQHAGTGLGLAVARDAVRCHHGQIRLRNRPGGGLRATVVLPRD